MPLVMAEVGRSGAILHVGGREDTRRFLESLGFVVGGRVTVVARQGGGVIVSVRESRVALSRELAAKIMI